MKVIAFGHRQRVGKDTAVKFAMSYIRSKYPQTSVARCSFGDEIKRVAHDMFCWAGLRPGIYYENHSQYKDEPLTIIGKSPRQIWIELGMKAREIDVRVWTELAFSRMSANLVFISDLRHPIELEYVAKFNGIAVRIDRPSEPQVTDGIDEALANHVFDIVLTNSGTIKEFGTQIQKLVENELNRQVA
jgi:hypothetical protein